VDLTLLSIAIIFPLVFTIRGSFRRREKALEHLSEFRSTLKTLKYFFLSNKNLTDNYKQEIETILNEINTKVLEHLLDRKSNINELDRIINKLFIFISDNNEILPRSLKDKLFRFMKDMHECVENLHAIHMHRTPISLKAYCKLFIYVFPAIYAPVVIYNLGDLTPAWVAYFIVLITEFILISLYNIQNQLEFPFDKIGLDDINLDNFKINR
jgi:predicted membrane chloride channel (bestrophin family)